MQTIILHAGMTAEIGNGIRQCLSGRACLTFSRLYVSFFLGSNKRQAEWRCERERERERSGRKNDPQPGLLAEE